MIVLNLMLVHLDSLSCRRDKIVGEKSKAAAQCTPIEASRGAARHNAAARQAGDNSDLKKICPKMAQIERRGRAAQSGDNFLP